MSKKLKIRFVKFEKSKIQISEGWIIWVYKY